MAILNALPGIVLPLLRFYFFCWRPLRRVRSAQSWRETPCVILSSGVTEDRSDSGYRVLVSYQYEWAGEWYSASRYNFSPSATSGRRGKRKAAARLVPGSTTNCYVNPDNPRDAVINRSVTW